MLYRVFLAALAFLIAQDRAQARTSALVVGADVYPYEVSLDGAVRDARDIEDALRRAGVQQIITFIDQQAVKSDIRAAWLALLDQAQPGDTIIFTYAGHGAQMPELVAGDEADGLDEFLQLPGFDRSRAAETGSEIILDNELNAWFAEAEAKDVQVLFVSDSCFSGGMSRSVTGKTRLAPAVTVRLPPPSPEALSGPRVAEASFRKVTMLSASLESQPTPEVIIDGAPRGALSWSFARAVEGRADRDGDGRLSRIELENYVLASVKSRSEALQVANFTPQSPRSGKEVMLALGGEAAVSVGQDRSRSGEPDDETGPHGTLALVTANTTLVPQRVGGQGVPYRWDAASGVVLTPNGDVAAEHVDAAGIQGVVDKFILLDILRDMASRHPGTVSLTPQEDIYARGDRVAIKADAPDYDNMLVFNLANTGEVQMLDAHIGVSAAFKLGDLEVVAPYGADHLIVIGTNEPVDAIATALRRGVDAATLEQLLAAHLAGRDASIAIQPLYTREKP